jgi:hypothetical protein
MPVPEAPVHEHDGAMRREYKIWSTGQITAMQTEAETVRVQTAAQRQFRFRVAATDAAHI